MVIQHVLDYSEVQNPMATSKMLELLIPISKEIILWAVCVEAMTAQSQTVIMQGILPLLSHLLL